MGRSTTKKTGVKVGDVVDLGKGNHMVVIPGGEVVTARSDFTPRAAGDYRVTDAIGAETQRCFTAEKADGSEAPSPVSDPEPS